MVYVPAEFAVKVTLWLPLAGGVVTDTPGPAH